MTKLAYLPTAEPSTTAAKDARPDEDWHDDPDEIPPLPPAVLREMMRNGVRMPAGVVSWQSVPEEQRRHARLTREMFEAAASEETTDPASSNNGHGAVSTDAAPLALSPDLPARPSTT